MEMIILALQVLSAAAILVAAVVFYRGVIKSKKPVEIKIDQPEFDPTVLQTHYELLLDEATKEYRDKLSELSKQNAELMQISAWLEQLDNSGDIDLNAISKNTAKRVEALRLEKAENAIVRAETNLQVVRQNIASWVEYNVKNGGKYVDKIKFWKAQEEIELGYLQEAQARFDCLVLSYSSR